MRRFITPKKCIIAFCALIISIGIIVFYNFDRGYASMHGNVLIGDGNTEADVIYLSDINYTKASVGWGTLTMDKTQDGSALSVRTRDGIISFEKGIWAHATSTIEYDISQYQDYAYFSTYYGINTTAKDAGNGVKFYIYTSTDGQEWTLRTDADPAPLKVSNNAELAYIDIRGAKYLRLYAYDNGGNASDNSVWADAKLVKADYNPNVMVPVEEFDTELKANYSTGPIKDGMILPLLQRDFINRIGQRQLRTFMNKDPKNREMLEWFLNDEEALRLWTIGGTPNGTYPRALQVLSDLYYAHKEDLTIEGITANGVEYKNLYLRMMLALSLTHSTNVGLWAGGNQLSDAVTRYEIYKQMHLDGKLGSAQMFEDYTIEEMRAVMITNIDDEEILWLHDYSEQHFSNLVDRFNPFKYIKYDNTFTYNYNKPQYYSPENYDKWNQKYKLSEYNITYQSGKPKLWIVFEEGAVCGGLSKTAANLYGVWGYPGKVLGQPGHAAYIYLHRVGGNNVWQLSYNVVNTGWANTSSGGRMPNGWGNRYASDNANIKPASYYFLSQQAQNEYDKYEKAELILLQEDIYKNDKSRLERVYRDALNEEIINLDAWIGLVDLYLSDGRSEKDIISLAREIADVYTFHPLPMYDLTRRLSTKLTSPEARSEMMMLQERTLKAAAKATSADTLYHKEVPIIANAILGVVDSSIASFSFDGNNAGKIVLSSQLQSAQMTWSYSLDGGSHWTEIYEHSVQLTPSEIASINDVNDIKIRISGLPVNDANTYTIDITKRKFPGGVTINDEEDRMFGTTSAMEWTLDPASGTWSSFANTNPVFSGDKKVYVRAIATGTQIASDPVYFTFTANNTDDTKWYVQSKNLQIESASSTKAGNYNNVLDGNINTFWRSPHDAGQRAYLTIKIDQPRYISGIDYVPDAQALFLGGIPYGRASKLNVYVSTDNVNWELAGTKSGLGDDTKLKHIDFSEAKKAQYVKIECDGLYSGPKNEFSASSIKLYENVIVNETPRADVNYNIVNPTNQNVTAELINQTRPITVTNNNGQSSYTFTENGEFTFEFEDSDGNKGSVTAKVDWIDKTSPTVDVVYSTTEPTNGEVVATLTFSKDNITILSQDIQVSQDSGNNGKHTITFDSNASYELEFADALGNVGRQTITVDWIDTVAPTADLEFDIMYLTNNPVTVTLRPDEPITVLNNNGEFTHTFSQNGSFTFEFVDRAGNHGSATAAVDWITDAIANYTLTYSIEQPTNQDVIATIEIEDGYRIVNEGGNTHTFSENGTFEFLYVKDDDPNNKVGVVIATVNWIDREAPTAELKYTKHKDKVVVEIINPSEEITFAEGEGVYEYTENGEYTIVFHDKAGNEGKLTAVIDSIGKDDEGDDKDPDNPGDNRPENPDNPNPDQPNPDSPSPDFPNLPDDSNNSSIDQPQDSAPAAPNNPAPNPIPSGNSPNGVASADQPSNLGFKRFALDNLFVELPTSLLPEGASMKSEAFELPNSLKSKFSSASETYHIYAVDSSAKKLDIESAEPFKIHFKPNSAKKLKGVYEITEDNTAKSIEHTKNDTGNIEISTNHFGRYVVDYEAQEANNNPSASTNNSNSEQQDTDDHDNYIIWTAAAAGVVAMAGIGVYLFRKMR